MWSGWIEWRFGYAEERLRFGYGEERCGADGLNGDLNMQKILDELGLDRRLFKVVKQRKLGCFGHACRSVWGCTVSTNRSAGNLSRKSHKTKNEVRRSHQQVDRWDCVGEFWRLLESVREA